MRILSIHAHPSGILNGTAVVMVAAMLMTASANAGENEACYQAWPFAQNESCQKLADDSTGGHDFRGWSINLKGAEAHVVHTESVRVDENNRRVE